MPVASVRGVDINYEVLGERDDCYVLSGLDKPFSKVRFEPVTPPIESPSEV